MFGGDYWFPTTDGGGGSGGGGGSTDLTEVHQRLGELETYRAAQTEQFFELYTDHHTFKTTTNQRLDAQTLNINDLFSGLSHVHDTVDAQEPRIAWLEANNTNNPAVIQQVNTNTQELSYMNQRVLRLEAFHTIVGD